MTTNDRSSPAGDTPAMDTTITLPAWLVERVARARVLEDDGTPLETVADKVKAILSYVTDEDEVGRQVPPADELGPPMQLTLTLPAGVVQWLERTSRYRPAEVYAAALLTDEARAAMSAATRAPEEDDKISF